MSAEISAAGQSQAKLAEAEIMALVDRAALAELVSRYAATVDARDLDGFADCFSEDAVAEYDGGIKLEGRPAIRTFMSEAFQSGIGLDKPSTHLMANTIIELDGNEARLRSTAIACLTNKPGKVIVRGLRYTDRCVREGTRWRFLHRRHEADWGFEADAQFVATMSAHTALSGAGNGAN